MHVYVARKVKEDSIQLSRSTNSLGNETNYITLDFKRLCVCNPGREDFYKLTGEDRSSDTITRLKGRTDLVLFLWKTSHV